VRTAVEAVRALGRPLDVLLANAGIMALPTLKQVGGYELQFATNHIGHFILVTGLLNVLSPEARVVILSSAAHNFAPKAGIEFDNLSGEKGYSPWTAYGQSKLANLLFARALAKRFEGTGRTANAVHPGVIATNLSRHIMSPLYRIGMGAFGWIGMKSIRQGAATECYVAVHPGARGINGQYWKDCNISRSSTLGGDDVLAERLWRESERIAGTH
jgi:NAD(P)-dependent dehydrogenase (short-subunit alcohol dehydrogenase family)